MNAWKWLKSVFSKGGADRTSARMYHAARPSRLTAGWVQSATTSADSEIRASLTNLRGRSRALIRDSAYAKRAKTIVVNNVIGGGIGLQGQVRSSRDGPLERANDGIEDAFKYWSKGAYCHTGGELHFADLERALVGEIFEAGEVFVRQHPVSFGGCRIPYALELIESERVPHDNVPTMAATGSGNEIRMGIEVDPFYRPVAYFVRDRIPSDFQFNIKKGSEQVRRIPADQIIHLRLIDRWPQVRGVPWLHGVARKLNDMDGYSEAEIVAARGAANYLGFLKRSDLDDSDIEEQDDGTFEIELSPGIVGRGPPGSEMQFNNPNRPNSALDPFMRYMLREVAAGVGVSYESLSRDYSQSNFSSSRLALLDDRDLWRWLQLWFIRSFRDIVHPIWLRQAVLAGEVVGVSVLAYGLNMEKFEAVKYKPRGWGWIDPTKEVEAYKEALKAGFTTRTSIIAQTANGDDVEDVDRERAQELDYQAELDLTYDTDPDAYAPPEPEPAPAPEPTEPAEPDEPSEPAEDPDRALLLAALNRQPTVHIAPGAFHAETTLEVPMHVEPARVTNIVPKAEAPVINNEINVAPTPPTPVEVKNEIRNEIPQYEVIEQKHVRDEKGALAKTVTTKRRVNK